MTTGCHDNSDRHDMLEAEAQLGITVEKKNAINAKYEGRRGKMTNKDRRDLNKYACIIAAAAESPEQQRSSNRAEAAAGGRACYSSLRHCRFDPMFRPLLQKCSSPELLVLSWELLVPLLRIARPSLDCSSSIPDQCVGTRARSAS